MGRADEGRTHFAFELNLFFVAVRLVPLGQAGFAPERENGS